MAHYTIQDQKFKIERASKIQKGWKYISDESIKKIISYEVQSYEFQKALLNKLHAEINYHGKILKQPLDFTLRAGVGKSIISSGVSIIEAVLREYGEQKGYVVKDRKLRLTFGKLITKWLVTGSLEKDPISQPYLKAILPTLKILWETRNDIHLFKTISNPGQYYNNVITRTELDIANLDEALIYLQNNKP